MRNKKQETFFISFLKNRNKLKTNKTIRKMSVESQWQIIFLSLYLQGNASVPFFFWLAAISNGIKSLFVPIKYSPECDQQLDFNTIYKNETISVAV